MLVLLDDRFLRRVNSCLFPRKEKKSRQLYSILNTYEEKFQRWEDKSLLRRVFLDANFLS